MPRGADTGWPLLDRHYSVRPGEWTLVTGIPGHGKSEFLDAMTINLAARHGWRFGIFSPENQPFSLHLAKLAEKYTGNPTCIRLAFLSGTNKEIGTCSSKGKPAAACTLSN